jgi:hypothetical protein
MTPARRRPATPSSKGPTKAATKDSTQLLGPDGAPTNQDAPTKEAGGDSAPPTGTGQVNPQEPATKQSPRPSRGRYPLPVWPD